MSEPRIPWLRIIPYCFSSLINLNQIARTWIAPLNNLHYLLGRNCLGISWVTQLGARSPQHPHHRPSGADNIVAPWPGLLSNGPNANPADPITKALPRRAAHAYVCRRSTRILLQ